MKLLNNRSEKIRNILVPVLSVIMGFLLGQLLWLSLAMTQWLGIKRCLKQLSKERKVLVRFCHRSTVDFTALGFSVANSAGFFNIGLSGQALCGWVAYLGRFIHA